MKDWHLCLGASCYREENFEELNCASPIEEADVEDLDSLGTGRPGCDTTTECDNGLYPPCQPPIEDYEGSAKVAALWPEVTISDLIPQPWNNPTPTRQIEVEEHYLPYVTQYSFGFWY